jgi:hypothetical protein
MAARWHGVALAVFWVALLVLPAHGPARAADALRLDETFRAVNLTPHLTATAQGGQGFALRNASSKPLTLMVQRAELNDLGVALGLQSGSRPPLRLFSSDDREFSMPAGPPNGLVFTIPGGAVQSFSLANLPAVETIYLWSPESLAAHQVNRQTFHAGVLFLLAILLGLSILAAILRRSRRAAYGVTMGGGLLVLLASLWMRDVFPDTQQFLSLSTYRLDAIRAGFGLGVVMSIIGHLNLVIRLAINRNYWTRVIILADIGLLAMGVFWTWEVLNPDFAGLISSELGDIALALTCGTVLLGAFFVPDRRNR